MAANAREDVPAKYRYYSVRYSHVPISPGQQPVLTADPWSYLQSYILQATPERKSPQRDHYRRARYYAQLAEDFYRASELVDLPTQGTLQYYGMLNLVKAYLATRRLPLESQVELHGLTISPQEKYEVNVQSLSDDSVCIFAEFAKALDTPPTGRTTLPLREVIRHIPELHSICYSLGFINKQKFLPINISFLTNHECNKLFTQVSYDKGIASRLPEHKFLRRARKDYFKKIDEKDNNRVYQSKKKKKLTRDNWPVVYNNILNEYSKFDIASLLTKTGYRYYCDLEPGEFHHLLYTFALMYYIGTAARYRPTEVEEVLSGAWRPIATEAMSLCPRQFLYEMVSLITHRLCVIPYAQI